MLHSRPFVFCESAQEQTLATTIWWQLLQLLYKCVGDLWQTSRGYHVKLGSEFWSVHWQCVETVWTDIETDRILRISRTGRMSTMWYNKSSGNLSRFIEKEFSARPDPVVQSRHRWHRWPFSLSSLTVMSLGILKTAVHNTGRPIALRPQVSFQGTSYPHFSTPTTNLKLFWF